MSTKPKSNKQEFSVFVREVHIQEVRVEAEDENDAKDRVAKGEGEYVDNSLEYSHCLDPDEWTVDRPEQERKSLEDVVKHINWDLLNKQKLIVHRMIKQRREEIDNFPEDDEKTEKEIKSQIDALDGIIQMIDILQDSAEANSTKEKNK